MSCDSSRRLHLHLHIQQFQLAGGFANSGLQAHAAAYVQGHQAEFVQLCQGAIAIARYGASWRGIKPKVAAEHGAVGCLI